MNKMMMMMMMMNMIMLSLNKKKVTNDEATELYTSEDTIE